MLLMRRAPRAVSSALAATARRLSSTATLRHVEIDGTQIAYREAGDTSLRPIVFLHGNPTSSHLWRDVMPHCETVGRLLAPDLVGMGESEKLPDGAAYTYAEHSRFLDGWFDALELSEVTLVLHDWGSALGFDWAERNRDRVAGIVHMESLTAPLEGWEQFPDSGRAIFQAMWTDAGEEIVLEKNTFVRKILPASIERKLSAHEMDPYLAPFAARGEARRPTLTWPRQIPIVGADGPHAHLAAHVIDVARRYAAWLGSEQCTIPKLYIHATPGFFADTLCWRTCAHWVNQERIDVRGLHFCQEDSPEEIGTAIAGFVRDRLGTS